MSLSDVQGVFTMLMEHNFPVLVAAVKAKVEQNLIEFASQLKVGIHERYNQIDEKNWTDPDVQALLISALNASGRKGKDANPALLAEVLLARVENSSSSFRSIVMNEAVEIIPKITKEQIDFVSLIYLVMNVLTDTSNNPSEWEPLCEIGYSFLLSSFDLPYVERQHLMYTGVTVPHGGTFGIDLFQHFAQSMDDSGDKLRVTQFMITNGGGFNQKLLYKFSEAGLANISLTAVGQVIAIANLLKYLPNLKYNMFNQQKN